MPAVKKMRFGSGHAIFLCAMWGGMVAVVIQKTSHLHVSPLKAALCGAVLGVIAAQLKWIWDLLRPGTRYPGSIVLRIEQYDALSVLASRWRAAACVAVGVLFFPLHRAFAFLFHRDCFGLIILGPVLVIAGLAGLLYPGLMVRAKLNQDVYTPGPQEQVMLLLSTLGMVIGMTIWVTWY